MENRRLDRYRIATIYHIESYQLLLYRGKPDITCITLGSAAVDRSHYTGQSKPFPALTPASRERRLIVYDIGGGGGAGGGRRL